MSRGRAVAWRARAAVLLRTRAGALALALAAMALAVTAAAWGGSRAGAAAPAETPSVDTERFEAFVQQVGIDMSEVPVPVRREWASSPKLRIDDCAIPGTHAGHGHGAAVSDTQEGERGQVQ